MNIDKLIQEVRNAVKKFGFCASEEIKDLLLKYCRRLTEEYDPFIDDLMSLYYKGSNFIVFEQQTTQRIGQKLHDAFKLRIFGPYQELLLNIEVLGPVLITYGVAS